MSVPIVPTATTIVTQALKRAGRTTPSATQIQEALDHQLQEVKADIMLIAPTHPNLLQTSTTVTTRGQQRYEVASDFNEHESISLMDGTDDWRGTAQGAAAFSITLAASLNVSADEIVGKYLIITGGVGIEQYREILAYDTGSHIATLDLDWETTPLLGSTYLIVGNYYQLYPLDAASELDRLQQSTSIGTPQQASLHGQEFLLYPVPDKSTYGLMNRYWVDLSMLDEDGNLFLQLLREWRSVWVQGIAVKSMQRYDEDRYQSELGVYKLMLDLLASETCQVTPMRQFDF